MSLQNLDAVDKRAHKLFNWCYVGPKSAGNNHGHIYSFDNDNEHAKPTHTFTMGGHYCSYCGERAYPIQANIKTTGCYDTTGHMCVCKKAMDELANHEAVVALKRKHSEELYELQKARPEPDPAMKHKRLMQLVKEAEKQAEAGDWWRHGHALSAIAEGKD